MPTLALGWDLEVSRGPGWLVVKVCTKGADLLDTPPLADELWSLLERHSVYRLALELDELELLHSGLIGQLLLLDRRIREHQGSLRLCGLSPFNQEVLRRNGLSCRLPNYASVQEALMGCCPRKPR